jgi:hypothetical protein
MNIYDVVFCSITGTSPGDPECEDEFGEAPYLFLSVQHIVNKPAINRARLPKLGCTIQHYASRPRFLSRGTSEAMRILTVRGLLQLSLSQHPARSARCPG